MVSPVRLDGPVPFYHLLDKEGYVDCLPLDRDIERIGHSASD